MDCPKCRKHNLPASVICIHCGYSFAGDSDADQPVPESYYPPRQKHRAARRIQSCKQYVSTIGQRTRLSFTDRKSRFTAVLSAVMSCLVPGSGMLFLGYWMNGLCVLGGCAVFAALSISTITQLISNVFIVIGMSIWYLGVFETIRCSQRRAGKKPYSPVVTFYSAVFAAGILLMLITVAALVLPGELTFPTMDYDLFPPSFLRDDRIVISSVSDHAVRNLERGDWVYVRINQELQTLALVVGTPGDTVDMDKNILTINAVEIDVIGENLPMINKEFSATVPDHSYLVWVTFQLAYHQFGNLEILGHTINPVPLIGRDSIIYNADPVICRMDQIEGIVLATIFPSSRRCFR
jgi:Signal peptidase, peptidase S26